MCGVVACRFVEASHGLDPRAILNWREKFGALQARLRELFEPSRGARQACTLRAC